jgi:hypothetical protein
MQKNFDDKSMQQALRMAQSEAGKSLIQQLKTQNGPALDAAMAQAQAGNFDEVKKTMEKLLADPKFQSLLEQLREGSHG